MRALLATEFAALLARADVSQAAFARLTGVTPRQVNNWCRGRAPVPAWAALVAILLDEQPPEALTIMVEEVRQTLADAEAEPPTR
jgi:DNA-binding transcriptional regulator YdaS (Cro superfamily)